MAINSLGSSLTDKLKDGVNWMAKPYRIALASLLLMTASSAAVKGQGVAINGTGAAPYDNATLHINRTNTAGTFIPNGTPLLTQGNLNNTINGAVLWNQSNAPGRRVRLLFVNRQPNISNPLVPTIEMDGRSGSYIEGIASGGGINASQSLGFGTAIDGATPAQEWMRLTSDGRLALGKTTALQKFDIREGNMCFSSSPDAFDISKWYAITNTYMPGLAGYKILSFDASNPLGPGSFSLAKMDFNRQTISLGRNTNAFSDIPLLSTVLYINPAGSSAGYDKYAAIFDSRTTVPSTSTLLGIKHQAGVLIYGNTNDVSGALQDPVALETIGGGLAVNGIIKEDSYPVGRWLGSFTAAPATPTGGLKNGDMYYNTTSFSLCVYDLPNTARRCCN